MCGEKYSCTGKTPFGCRITPACAGKSGLAALDHALAGDHPRVCGEKQFKFSTSFTVRGSPPHVRGKVGVVKLLSELPRITPACAGKRAKIKGATESSGDHPRMCGEKCTPLKP